MMIVQNFHYKISFIQRHNHYLSICNDAPLYNLGLYFLPPKNSHEIMGYSTTRYCNPFIIILIQSSTQTVLFCYIYMYRTLTNPKLLRCLPHCRIIFYYISCDLNGPLLNIIFHGNPCIICLYNLCRAKRQYAECTLRFVYISFDIYNN